MWGSKKMPQRLEEAHLKLWFPWQQPGGSEKGNFVWLVGFLCGFAFGGWEELAGKLPKAKGSYCP